jgi:hypothetical protein
LNFFVDCLVHFSPKEKYIIWKETQLPNRHIVLGIIYDEKQQEHALVEDVIYNLIGSSSFH